MVQARMALGLVPLAVVVGAPISLVAVPDHGAVAVVADRVTHTAVATVVAG